MPPTTAQLSLLIVAVLLFGAGGVLSFARMWSDRPRLQRVGKAFLRGGITASIGVLIWHSLSRGKWMPVDDNFDALVWLATLLALFVLYVQRNRPLGGLDWFVMPVVVLLLLGAAFFGKMEYQSYVEGTWHWVHRVTAYGGAVAFAIAAASGAMYVLTSRRLRNKSPVPVLFGSLERLEHLTMTAVTLGFALLTVGLITGGVEIVAAGHHTPLPKIILGAGVWIIYAIVLHAPINPSFRGRKVAVLSMVGFVLMLGVIVTVLMMPGGR
jgi:ABC-type uncharacterized transport system permease subunit